MSGRMANPAPNTGERRRERKREKGKRRRMNKAMSRFVFVLKMIVKQTFDVLRWEGFVHKLFCKLLIC